jgi:hypothetical protein
MKNGELATWPAQEARVSAERNPQSRKKLASKDFE